MNIPADCSNSTSVSLNHPASCPIGYGMSKSPNPTNGVANWRFYNQAAFQPGIIQPSRPPQTPTKAAGAIEPQTTAKPLADTNTARRHVSPSNARAPRPQHRRDVADWAPAYLAALEASARKAASAKLAGVTLRSVQRRRVTDANFAAEEAAAMMVASDMIEDEITRWAIEGVEEPVFGSGGKGCGTVQVGTIRRFSDTLLLRLAERSESGSWRQKQQVEHSTPGMFATRADRKAALEKARADIAREDAKERAGGQRALLHHSENGG
jgi:hypothetical protein